MAQLIGITGRKGSGKDTAALGLAGQWPIIKFAGALKAMLEAYLYSVGADFETRSRMLEGDLKEEPSHLLCGKTPRYAMQTLGTEWGRKIIYPDIWVQATMLRAKLHQRAIVTDVRFPNEAQAIRDNGGIIIKIIRPGYTTDTNHESERHIDEMEANYYIVNDKSIEFLKTSLKELVDLHYASSILGH